MRQAANLTEERLGSVGLSGTQLAIKLDLWRAARALAVQEFDQSDDPMERQRATFPGRIAEDPSRRLPAKLPRRLGFALRVVQWLLQEADAILDSLSRVLPVVEPLRELKEMVERTSGRSADLLGQV